MYYSNIEILKMAENNKILPFKNQRNYVNGKANWPEVKEDDPLREKASVKEQVMIYS